MPIENHPQLEARQTLGAEVRPGNLVGQRWHLEIPSGPKGSYRLAQLDDYAGLPRYNFPWRPPVTLSLRARTSALDIPGTWGFGFWNDPFSLSLGLGGGTRRFPALPNAAWFFFAAPQNYLSFRDDQPAQGFLAQSFQSSQTLSLLPVLGALALPMLFWPWLARKLRPLFRRWIAEDSCALEIDVTQWQEYKFQWCMDGVTFWVNDQTFKTTISPKAPLGLVIWIDNQYAAFPPNGQLSYGTLENPQPAWLEVENLRIVKG